MAIIFDVGRPTLPLFVCVLGNNYTEGITESDMVDAAISIISHYVTLAV